MDNNPLRSLADYSRFVVALLDRPTVERSTVVVWSTGPYTGVAEGEIFFSQGFRLRIREELDFDAGFITMKHIWVRNDCIGKMTFLILMTRRWSRLFLTTSMFHLTSNAIPAPEIRFTRPNLPVIIQEIEELIGRKMA